MNFNGSKFKSCVNPNIRTGWVKLVTLDFMLPVGIFLDSETIAHSEFAYALAREVIISRNIDMDLSKLSNESISGSVGNVTLINIVKTATNKPDKYIAYELENCRIKCANSDIYRSNIPMESLSISFAKITKTTQRATEQTRSRLSTVI